MTFFNRLLLALLAILMVAGAGEFIALRATRARLESVQAQLATVQTTLRSTNAAMKTRTKALSAAQAQLAAARKDLDHALQENPGWASTAVPDAVWDRLYGAAASGPAR
jgi:Tfp pilus assembly protein PilO